MRGEAANHGGGARGDGVARGGTAARSPAGHGPTALEDLRLERCLNRHGLVRVVGVRVVVVVDFRGAMAVQRPIHQPFPPSRQGASRTPGAAVDQFVSMRGSNDGHAGRGDGAARGGARGRARRDFIFLK